MLKKRHSIITLLFAMISLFALVSCDDNKKEIEVSSIEGMWTGTATYSDGSMESFTYSFKSNGTFSAKWWSGAINDYDPSNFGILSGRYEYDSSLGILSMTGVDEDGESFYEYMSCTISGKTMIWVSEFYGGMVELTKMSN